MPDTSVDQSRLQHVDQSRLQHLGAELDALRAEVKVLQEEKRNDQVLLARLVNSLRDGGFPFPFLEVPFLNGTKPTQANLTLIPNSHAPIPQNELDAYLVGYGLETTGSAEQKTARIRQFIWTTHPTNI